MAGVCVGVEEEDVSIAMDSLGSVLITGSVLMGGLNWELVVVVELGKDTGPGMGLLMPLMPILEWGLGGMWGLA